MSWHNTHRTIISQAILACLLGTTSLAHAISLGQADILSAQHEPLSATIEVSDIDAKNFNASLATTDIYQQLGLNANAKIEVKFTATSDSSGLITLTSTTPISAPFTDIVLNLNDNGKQVIEPQTLLMPLPKSGTFKLPEQNTQIIATGTQHQLPVVSPDAKQTSTNTTEIEPAMASSQKAGIGKTTTNKQNSLLSEQAGQNSHTIAQNVDSLDDTKTNSQPSTSGKTYVVQSGDSLWSIANQLAKANNMSVKEVMKAIHATNPDAFNHGKMNQLKANVSLELPDYEVIPSQKAIQEAIHAKQQQKQTTKKTTSTTKKGSPQQTVAKNTTKPTQTKRTKQALPRAQVTLVTPTQQGKATGTHSKPNKNASTGGDSNLVGALKNTRQQTASSAKQINSLNKELSSATQKLQLQNQKLAELEARLKALKDKK